LRPYLGFDEEMLQQKSMLCYCSNPISKDISFVACIYNNICVPVVSDIVERLLLVRAFTTLSRPLYMYSVAMHALYFDTVE
jgi:hypothetical protein